MISDRFKLFLFKQLYKELSNIEIIPYDDSIYFIDRDKKYWYFEYEKCGTLWWRYDFFSSFFLIFSLEFEDYQKIMGDWVEEVLNHKVSTTLKAGGECCAMVEEVLNHKVSTTINHHKPIFASVEEVLNHKVSTTRIKTIFYQQKLEEVLNHKVSTTLQASVANMEEVEEVLKTERGVDLKDYSN